MVSSRVDEALFLIIHVRNPIRIRIDWPSTKISICCRHMRLYRLWCFYFISASFLTAWSRENFFKFTWYQCFRVHNHWIRIRTRIQIFGEDSDPGYWYPKVEKILQFKKNSSYFDKKNCNIFIPRTSKLQEKLQPPKRISSCSNRKFFT